MYQYLSRLAQETGFQEKKSKLLDLTEVTFKRTDPVIRINQFLIYFMRDIKFGYCVIKNMKSEMRNKEE